MNRYITIIIDEKKYNYFKKLCKQEDIPMTQLIRKLIQLWVNKQKPIIEGTDGR